MAVVVVVIVVAQRLLRHVRTACKCKLQLEGLIEARGRELGNTSAANRNGRYVLQIDRAG